MTCRSSRERPPCMGGEPGSRGAAIRPYARVRALYASHHTPSPAHPRHCASALHAWPRSSRMNAAPKLSDSFVLVFGAVDRGADFMNGGAVDVDGSAAVLEAGAAHYYYFGNGTMQSFFGGNGGAVTGGGAPINSGVAGINGSIAAKNESGAGKKGRKPARRWREGAEGGKGRATSASHTRSCSPPSTDTDRHTVSPTRALDTSAFARAHVSICT